jgi:hypothetical protein
MRPAIQRAGSLRQSVIYSAIAGLVAITGCGDGKIARYPVKGSVKVDGQPAEGAIVIFCPVDAGPEWKDLRPSGKTDAAGEFQLLTFESNDGAPAGQYKVIINWPAPPQPGAEDREGRGPRPGPDRLKGKYYNIDRSPFSVTVEKKTNSLEPFELKSN